MQPIRPAPSALTILCGLFRLRSSSTPAGYMCVSRFSYRDAEDLLKCLDEPSVSCPFMPPSTHSIRRAPSQSRRAFRFLRYAALRAWRTKARQAHSDWKRRDHSSSVPKAHLSERRGHTNLKSARRELWKSQFRFGPQSQVAREKARRRASAIIHSVALRLHSAMLRDTASSSAVCGRHKSVPQPTNPCHAANLS